MDNNLQEGVNGVGSIRCKIRERDTASTSNPLQDNEESEYKRFRKSENQRSDFNDYPSRTYLRESSLASRPSSQFSNVGLYNGRPMMSNYNDMSNGRWSKSHYRGNSNWQPNFWHRDGYAPNAGWSNENFRDFDARRSDYRAENPTWPNEHHRHVRYENNAPWSNDWNNRQQTYGIHGTEDPTRHERHGSWWDQRNHQGNRYGSHRVEDIAQSDVHHRPRVSYENYRQGSNFSSRYENPNFESYRRGGRWSPQYSTRERAPSYSARGRDPSYLSRERAPSYMSRGRAPSYSNRGSAPSYHERCMAMASMKNAENLDSAAKVSLSSAEKLNVTVDSLPAADPELSCRQLNHQSDLNKIDDAFHKQDDGGCCNIEVKREVNSERSSELESSDCKTKLVKDHERLENGQRQALENCFSQEETVNNNVSSVQILSKPLDGLLPFPKGPVLATNSKRKLLILDINGLLADIVFHAPKDRKHDAYFHGRAIFKRPFCLSFLEFCFERFHVGIWSSRNMKIVDGLVDCLLGNWRSKLVLCWDISKCTSTNFKTVDNKNKGLVFKELKKIWENDDPKLPWKKGEYNASNTILLDDSPYKSLLNPSHCAVFPKSYTHDHTDDESLGPKGDIRDYLEKLAEAEDVQKYVEQNPFGQKAIDETDSNWSFYSEIVSSYSTNTLEQGSYDDKVS